MPLQTCLKAVESISHISGLRIVAVSRWYRTRPVPPSAQPLYVNGVVRLEGSIDPADLLRRLQAIELAAGRSRGEPNAARTLDLDIIDLNAILRDTPDPVLPHPRAHQRCFVLVPLTDVAPDWQHPRLHRSVENMLRALPTEEILAIPPPSA
jgi:2-amino-4-hydroxy-6-hydroxymethyldihydropteridine diphosphokinase